MTAAMTQVPVPTATLETKALNQAVKRNPKRFEGEEFMFKLTKEEWRAIKVQVFHSQSAEIETVPDLQSQIVTAKFSRWDRYLGMTAAMTQVPVPTATVTQRGLALLCPVAGTV